MPRATTLEDARKVLDPRPLDFSGKVHERASDPEFHVPFPEQQAGSFKLPGPITRLEKRLLTGTRDTKLFLSGHIGSGKSTELNLLMVKREITERFAVVPLRFEEQEWATLDSSQVLFRIAAELFHAHADKLAKNTDGLKKKLATLNERVFAPVGIQMNEGTVGLEINAIFIKVKQDLKLSAKLRQQFREFGETNQSFLQDLIANLVDDIEEALTKEDGPNDLLVVVDDLDKLRSTEQHTDVFDTNLAALMAPPLRVLYTVPTAVRFSADVRAEIRNNAEDLFPVRVLKKAVDTWNPEDAFDDERIGFFHALVDQRVARPLIDRAAIRLAAIYSGGVLRDFFRLLREGVLLATYNGLPALDGTVMRYAVEEERRKESVGMYAPDYDALVHVHRTNSLRSAADRRYLALSRVIEAFNGTVWFEANPVLWHVLEEHVKRHQQAESG
ncbi:P-loop NTPase fold protein [Polyangium jinanense]|uniref:KAP NTPase domain-containing protein n=1 Tax=Polyangium jinanense TaxID=2829994 RepID=A0A9X4AQ79_9BACT|nr:P-loop NTPase fold protein [Polyangium jinanense]MDC3952433.1 hypothetical protein [Polyangium jinanense]MDC3980061.1 hypothetical protein [Polyangium jinanense]